MSMSSGVQSTSASVTTGTVGGNNGGMPSGGGGGVGAFAFPKAPASRAALSGLASRTQVQGGGHGRSGSSGSASFSRQAGSGLGALNFGGPSLGRLPTHAESLDSPARPAAAFPVRRTTRESDRSASSSDTEPNGGLEYTPAAVAQGVGLGVGAGGGGGSGFGQWKMPSKAGGGVRRESMSAEKAMREVEKAMAGVEAR